MIIRVRRRRRKEGRRAGRCIEGNGEREREDEEKSGEGKTSGRNRKRLQRWEGTMGGRVRLKVKSCTRMVGREGEGVAATSGRCPALDIGWCSFKGWRWKGETEERAFRAESGSACRSLTWLSNFDTIKTERINLHPQLTPSAGSRRDAGGWRNGLKKKRERERRKRAISRALGRERSSSFSAETKGQPLYVNPFHFGRGTKVTLIRKARRDSRFILTVLTRTHVLVWGFLSSQHESTDFIRARCVSRRYIIMVFIFIRRSIPFSTLIK